MTTVMTIRFFNEVPPPQSIVSQLRIPLLVEWSMGWNVMYTGPTSNVYWFNQYTFCSAELQPSTWLEPYGGLLQLFAVNILLLRPSLDA
jgi:hypothetical protein